jgi:hypothetical protein
MKENRQPAGWLRRSQRISLRMLATAGTLKRQPDSSDDETDADDELNGLDGDSGDTLLSGHE